MTYRLSDWRAGKQPPKDGWDAADAVADGWSRDDLDAFMRETVREWKPPQKPAELTAERVQAPEPVKAEPESDLDPEPSAGQDSGIVEVVEAKQQPATVRPILGVVSADDNWKLELVFNEDGKVKPSAAKNWALFLEFHPELVGTFAFDAFKMAVMLMRCPPWEPAGASWEPRPLRERDYSEAVMWLEGRYLTPKVSSIAPIISAVAERSSFDRLREYLEALVWDGKHRVAQFAGSYLGVKGDNYAPIVSEKWLVSSVARGLKPGCKVDTMPIIEGPQGALKSTALRRLYGDDFFTDELSDIGSKDAMMELQGVWGLEVAEMHRFSAAETNAVKKFLSRQTDRFRPPYGRSVIEAPRRVVLNGTINPEGNPYLRDPTGARRFWPLECGRIELDKIGRDRDQLWAEAVTMFKAGASWWINGENNKAVEVEQEKRTDVDVWTAMIAAQLKSRTSIAQDDLFAALEIPKKDRDVRHAARVGRIMKKLGWNYTRDRTDGQDRTVFKNPNSPPLEHDEDAPW